LFTFFLSPWFLRLPLRESVNWFDI